MVRKYKRKTTQQSWDKDKMKLDILEVRSGRLTVKAAATQYNVLKTTLFRKAKKSQEENLSKAAQKGLGRFKTVFNA
jgi:hypothetical protein